jgi:hypothetical protein
MTEVTVNFLGQGLDPAFESGMSAWLAPYITAGNTPESFPGPVAGLTLSRTWDTIENAQAYIDKVITYNNVTSASIVA